MDAVFKVPSSEFNEELFKKIIALVKGTNSEITIAVKEKTDIELVLMDLMMPVMDGYEATRKIRIFRSLEVLPIIAVTADATEGLQERCEEAGCNEYITKPIRKEVIEQVLRKYLGMA